MPGPTIHTLKKEVAHAADKLLQEFAKKQKPTERHYRLASSSLTETIFKWYREHLEDQQLEELLLKKLSKSLLARKLAKDGVPKPLLSDRTLRTILNDGEGAASSLAVLEAYHYVLQKQKEEKQRISQNWNRLNGLYYQLNTHSSTPDKFQESLFLLEDGHVWMRYLNHHGKEVEYEMQVNRVSKHHLMLIADDVESMHDDLTLFYLYVAPNKGKPDFLQGVYIYSNKDGEAVANLGIFCRVKKVSVKPDGHGGVIAVTDPKAPRGILEVFDSMMDAYKILPVTRERSHVSLDSVPHATSEVARELESRLVLENVQYFLHRHGQPVMTRLYKIGTQLFDFAKDLTQPPGPYHRVAQCYRDYLPLVGEYYLYFNEGYPSRKAPDERSLRTDYFSTVSRGVMTIEQHPVSGALFCRVTTRKTENDTLVYEGWIQNHELTAGNYLSINLTLLPARSRCLNLLFNVVSDYRLIGGYTATYTSPGQIGTGVIVALRTKLVNSEQAIGEEEVVEKQVKIGGKAKPQSQKQQQLDPKAFIPYREEVGASIERNIIRYLALNQRSQITIPHLRKGIEEQPSNPHSGLYHLYSQRSNGMIARQLLVLYPFGGVHLYAQIEQPQPSKLKNSNREGVAGTEPIVGKVDFPHGHVLNAVLKVKNSRDDLQTSFLSIRVADVPPRPMLTWYSASFAGLDTENFYTPVAGLALLNFQGSTIPNAAELQTKQRQNQLFDPTDGKMELAVREYFKQPSYLKVARPVQDLESLWNARK